MAADTQKALNDAVQTADQLQACWLTVDAIKRTDLWPMFERAGPSRLMGARAVLIVTASSLLDLGDKLDGFHVEIAFAVGLLVGQLRETTVLLSRDIDAAGASVVVDVVATERQLRRVQAPARECAAPDYEPPRSA